MTRTLIVLIAAVLLAPAAADSKPQPSASNYSLGLIRKTDVAVRRTTSCRAAIGEAAFPIRRTYARVESVAFRLWSLHLWRVRRAACAIELARLGVPAYFERIMLCIHPKEASDWHYNGPSGFDGGLQFLPSTWDSAGGKRFAPFAYQASPREQIRAAFDLTGGSVSAIRHHWPNTSVGCV